jgi:hypothetical protein
VFEIQRSADIFIYGQSTSQPQPSQDFDWYGDTTPVVTEHPATYGGGTTTDNYLRYDPGLSPSSLLGSSFEIGRYET